VRKEDKLKKVKIREEDGRQEISLPAGRRELSLIRERLRVLLSTLTLDKEKEIAITKIKRIPNTRSYIFFIFSESESGEFDSQMTQLIQGVIKGVLLQTRRKKKLKKGGGNVRRRFVRVVD